MNKIRSMVVMLFLFITIASCKKETTIKLPLELTTDEVTEVEWGIATSGGDVKTDGGSIVAFRGVVWDTKPNPTLSLETKTNDGRGLGTFKSKLNGLIANTKYYVRSYAVNSKDTMYGNEVIFKTSNWLPKDIKNTFDWWNSENGIVKEDNSVEYWFGSNGNKLDHGDDKNRALLIPSDKDWNNRPSVLMNPNFQYKDCGYYVKSNSNRTDKTVFIVSKVYDIHKMNNIMINFGIGVFGVWGYANGSYFVHHYGYPHFNVGTKFAKDTYQFIRFSYDRTNGGTNYYTDNIPSFRSKIHTFLSKPNLDYLNRKIGVGYYSSNYGQTPKMSVVEVLVLDGIPSEDELIMYEKYLKYKYKL